MSRERIYSSDAERQAAYRARLAERTRLAGTGQLTGRLRELETALAAATWRAEGAEERAARAEKDAAAGRRRFDRDLATALGRVADLEATVAELRRQLTSTAADASGPASTAGLNRAARRAAKRDRRRRDH
jgi:hypothetical protein